MMTRMNPKCRLYCGPNSSGKTAVSFIGGVFGLLEPGACSRPGRAQHPRDQVERDVVEHDRDDHLVRAGPGLERTGDARPERPGGEPGDEGDDHVDAPRQVERERHPAGRGGGHQHLPAAADVEHADAEGERDAEAGRDERGREGERLGERTDAARRTSARRSCRSSPGTARRTRPQTASQIATSVSSGRAKK